jgi:hypothetical protein
MAQKSSSSYAANTMPMHGLVVRSRLSGVKAAVSIPYGSAWLSILFAVAQPAIGRVCKSAVIIARLHHCAMRMTIAPVHAKRVIDVRTYERR